MSGDPRLVPIGKTGEWDLASRNPDARKTILELMDEAFALANAPLSLDQVASAVEEQRPGSRASVSFYLGMRDRYTELTDGRWVPSSWPEAKAIAKVVRKVAPRRRLGMSQADRMAAILFPMLEAAPAGWIPLADAISAVVRSLGVKYQNVYQYLDKRIPGLYRTDVDRQVVVHVRRPPGLGDPITNQEVEALIATGPGARLAFLPALRWNAEAGFDDSRLARRATRAIAALANSEGGTVVIGVAPDGRIVGLGRDRECLGDSSDRWTTALYKSLADAIARDLGVAGFPLLAPSFAEVVGETVLVVRVAVGREPLWLLDGDKSRLLVSRDSEAVELSGPALAAYRVAHVPWAGQK
jgi:hypothetical protein